jgi:hypothetical protein
MMNYCINLDMIVFKENKEKIAKNHFEILKNDKIEPQNLINKDILSIFINFSTNSNSYVNFLHDDQNKFLNKYIKIYFLRKNSVIEEFIGPLFVTQDKLNKIYSIIGHMNFDLNTGYLDVLHNYIKVNNVKNHFIYY